METVIAAVTWARMPGDPAADGFVGSEAGSFINLLGFDAASPIGALAMIPQEELATTMGASWRCGVLG